VWGKGTQKAPPLRSVKRRSNVATISARRPIPCRRRRTTGNEDEPERHFIGWADEVDVDKLFASGRAWGLQVVHRST